METLRSFIALPTSLEARQSIADVQTSLKETQANVKWESQEKFHITLIFLGTVAQSKLELLSTELAKSAQQFRSFPLTYVSIGAFPNAHAPRVVWVGIQDNPVILGLQAAVQKVCEGFGFPKEDRSFHPHITLGRMKEPHNLGRLTEAIKTITFEPIETPCSELLLMKSELHPSGSRYTILKSFPLNM